MCGERLISAGKTNNKHGIPKHEDHGHLHVPSPPFMKTNVGMALTLYFAAVSGFSSTSTLRNTTSGMFSLNSANYVKRKVNI